MTSALDTLLVVGLVFGGVFGFVGFWMGVCVLLGLLGGWQGLATRYRTSEAAPLGSQNVTARLGLVRYNGVLEVGAGDDGLDLRVMALFRAGHPPLRIPWAAVRVEGETKGLFGSFTRVRLGHGPLLKLPTEVWTRIQPG